MGAHDHLVSGEAAGDVEFAIRLLGAKPARNIDPIGVMALQSLLGADERFKVIFWNGSSCMYLSSGMSCSSAELRRFNSRWS